MRPAARRTAVIVPASMALLLTGCVSPEQKLEAAARSARSWEATLGMTSDALVHQNIPRLFGQQILEAAREYERASRRRPEWQSLPPRMRWRLSAAADRLALNLGSSPEGHDR